MKKILGVAALCIAAIGIANTVPAQVSAPTIAGVTPERPVRVLFVGDIMLDRNVARTIAAEGPEVLFDGTRALLADADVRVGNLEGTITDNPSIAQRDSKILHFTFDPSQAAAALVPLRFDIFSLANNHAFDFGISGYEQTKAEVVQKGIASGTFGHPYNSSDDLSIVLNAQGKTLCFVGYHSLYVSTTTSVIHEITTLRPDCWRVVVFAHWGEEYITHSNAAQQEAAHAFIDAGADLVIGAHPHVVEEREVYKGKAIFYSLGNFMFDQNFSWETTHGLAIRADFYEEKTVFTMTPTTIIDQRSGVASGAERETIFARLGQPMPADGQVAEFTLP